MDIDEYIRNLIVRTMDYEFENGYLKNYADELAKLVTPRELKGSNNALPEVEYALMHKAMEQLLLMNQLLMNQLEEHGILERTDGASSPIGVERDIEKIIPPPTINDDMGEPDEFEQALNAVLFGESELTAAATDRLIHDFIREAEYDGAVIQFLPLIEQVIRVQTDNINTLAKRFVSNRKVMKERFGPDSNVVKESFEYGVTREEHAQRMNACNDKVQENNRNQKQIDAKEILQLIIDLKKSDNVIDWIIAVQLATGSRLIEVLRLSDYHLHPASPNQVTVTGVAKNGKKGLSAVLDRHILGDFKSDELVYFVKLIRGKLEETIPDYVNLTNEELTAKLITQVSRRIKSFKINDFRSSGDARKIWTSLTHLLLPTEEKAKISKTQHITDSLGHTTTNSALYYNNVNIVNVPDTPSNVNIGIYDIYGKPHFIKGNKERDGLNASGKKKKAVDKLSECMREMELLKILINDKMLIDLGFGSRTIQQCRDHKQAIIDKIKPLALLSKISSSQGSRVEKVRLGKN
jgi:hypothetical protein